MVENENIDIQAINESGNHIVNTKCKQKQISIEKSAFSIKVPVKGMEHYKVENKNYVVKSGEFLVVNQNQSIDVSIKSNQDVIGKCVYLDEKMVNEIMNDIFNRDFLSSCDTTVDFNLYNGKYNFGNDGLSRMLVNLVNCTNTNDNEEWYYSIAFEMLKHQIGINKLMNQLNISKVSTKQELHSRLNKAKSFITDNYHEDLTIDNISLNANISKFHLIRTFKDVYGDTPYNYLTKVRLSKANELLSYKSLSLEEIALKTGFNDRQNLSRNFKKSFGYSPSEFRNF
ncbi:AraC family transcriptional regulator [uncultured Winogradskyella sp.]|uniref:helix-turn-helix domain-containing protein n=1 Tax=uncultured Winogradskyella sp. TaxID=395353 RepID=UPI00262D37A7|nr:AraC family transcriptional regulator [uncultured Winogradskyella sp.]